MRVTITVEVQDSVLHDGEDLEWLGYEIDDKLRVEYAEGTYIVRCTWD